MSLYDADPTERERKAIWRILETQPLRAGLAEGLIWSWYAVDIPMNLVPNMALEGDLDLVGRFRRGRGTAVEFIYRVWEVKVTLVDRFGRPRSLKAGKTARYLRQLKKARELGCPEISLLELYIYESGSLSENQGLPDAAVDLIRQRAAELEPEGIGYKVLPFEFGAGKQEQELVFVPARSTNPLDTGVAILRPKIRETGARFHAIACELSDFYERQHLRPEYRKLLGFISYCQNCRSLVMSPKGSAHLCCHCGREL